MRSTHSLLAIASHFEYGGVAQLGARCTQKRTHIEQLKKFNTWGYSSAGSPKHSETHPTKNLINKLFDVRPYGGVAQLGERLNGIQEVKSSILSVSTTVHRTIIFLPAFKWVFFYDILKTSLLSSIMIKRWCCYEYGRKN